MAKKNILISILFTWLAILSLGLFILATRIKFNSFITTNINFVFYGSAIAILAFIILGKLTLKALTNKVESELPK